MIRSSFLTQKKNSYKISQEEALVWQEEIPNELARVSLNPLDCLYFQKDCYSPKEFNALASYVAGFQIFGDAYLVCNDKDILLKNYDANLFRSVQSFVGSIGKL